MFLLVAADVEKKNLPQSKRIDLECKENVEDSDSETESENETTIENKAFPQQRFSPVMKQQLPPSDKPYRPKPIKIKPDSNSPIRTEIGGDQTDGAASRPVTSKSTFQPTGAVFKAHSPRGRTDAVGGSKAKAFHEYHPWKKGRADSNQLQNVSNSEPAGQERTNEPKENQGTTHQGFDDRSAKDQRDTGVSGQEPQHSTPREALVRNTHSVGLPTTVRIAPSPGAVIVPGHVTIAPNRPSSTPANFNQSLPTSVIVARTTDIQSNVQGGGNLATLVPSTVQAIMSRGSTLQRASSMEFQSGVVQIGRPGGLTSVTIASPSTPTTPKPGFANIKPLTTNMIATNAVNVNTIQGKILATPPPADAPLQVPTTPTVLTNLVLKPNGSVVPMQTYNMTQNPAMAQLQYILPSIPAHINTGSKVTGTANVQVGSLQLTPTQPQSQVTIKAVPQPNQVTLVTNQAPGVAPHAINHAAPNTGMITQQIFNHGNIHTVIPVITTQPLPMNLAQQVVTVSQSSGYQSSGYQTSGYQTSGYQTSGFQTSGYQTNNLTAPQTQQRVTIGKTKYNLTSLYPSVTF